MTIQDPYKSCSIRRRLLPQAQNYVSCHDSYLSFALRV